MANLTLFSFGYFGWGNSTKQLVQAVDAVERSRGFKPPIFVDTRIRRSVRAVGFREKTFETLLGSTRYRWMKELGNEWIVKRIGPKIQIADPSAVEDLLDLAANASKDRRRLIFFCGCQWPKLEGKISCHRTVIGELLLKAAKKQGKKLAIVEWPGGTPAHVEVNVPSSIFKAVKSGRMFVPIGIPKRLAEIAGKPWGSIASFHSESETIHRIIGPAQWQKGQWCLPVLKLFYDPATGLPEYKREAAKDRKQFGVEERLSG